MQRISDAYRYGPIGYIAAFALAFVSVIGSLALNLGLALYFALPQTKRNLRLEMIPIQA